MTRATVCLCAAVLLLAGCYGLGAGVKLPPLETARDFLVDHQPEEAGYGLYSYLLFGSPPTPASRDRSLATIAAYLDFISRREDLEEYVPRAQLNITYLFLTEAPPPVVANLRAGDLPAGGDMAPAEWVLDHYDYARARAVLHAIPGAHVEGPYIVSALAPLTGARAAPGGHLEQDLSHVPPEFAAAWVKTFLAQSAQPNTWGSGALQQAALTLRQTLSVAADKWPPIQHALEKWITWAG